MNDKHRNETPEEKKRRYEMYDKWQNGIRTASIRLKEHHERIERGEIPEGTPLIQVTTPRTREKL